MDSIPLHNRCELCERTLIAGTTAHHLIPRRCHRVRWFRARFTREELQQTVPLCRDCHSAVHEFVSDEKELGKHYATVDALRAHPAIARFLTWVRKQR